MDKYKKLAGNTMIFAIATFSSKFISFLLLPFITRMMATGDYSTADLVQQTVNFLIPPVFLQINSACLRFALDKAYDKRDVFSVGVWVSAAGFAVFLLFAYPLSLVRVHDFHMGEYVLLIYIFTLVSGLRQMCQQFVRGCEQVKIFAVDGVLATVTNLCFTLLFLGVFKWGVNGFVLAIVASDFCSVLFLTFTQKLWRYVKIRGIPRQVFTDMLRYSVPMIPSIILWWIINVSDRYMVTYFCGSSANGLYTAASKIPNILVIASTIFMDAWQLSAVDEYKNKDGAQFFSNIFRVYTAGVFSVSSFLILSCRLITRVLVADAYYDSWRYVPLLVIATGISGMVIFLASVYMAEKKNMMAMLTALLGAVANAVMNILFIPKWGAAGAAIATIISFALVYLTRIPSTKRYIGINLHTPMLILQLAILAAQSILMLFVENTLWLYVGEGVLFALMLAINARQIVNLVRTLANRFIKKRSV